MKSVKKQYISEMKSKFSKYNVTWAPGVPLQVGDIGVFDKDGAFDRKSNLKNLKIAFEIRPDTTNDQLEYSSKGSVSITAKLSGQVAPQGSVLQNLDAGVVVDFSKDSSVVFKAKNVTYPSIEDEIMLEQEIIALYKKGQWDKNWCIVTQLAVAESATVIISNSSNSKIELKANANIGAARIDIADASLDFSTQFAKDLNTTIIAQEGLTPLLVCKKLNFSGGFLKPKYPSGLGQHNIIKDADNAVLDINTLEEIEHISLEEFNFNAEEEQR